MGNDALECGASGYVPAFERIRKHSYTLNIKQNISTYESEIVLSIDTCIN